LVTIPEGVRIRFEHPQCVPVCPEKAIYANTDVLAEQLVFIDLSRYLARERTLVMKKKDALPDAPDWSGLPGKLEYLER